MNNLLTLKNGLIFFTIVFLAAQLIRIDKINYSQTTSSDVFQVLDASTSVQEIIKTACYDCHSDQPRYPWYASVAPVSWKIGQHIEEGRDELNFSKWATYSAKRRDHKLEEMIEEVEGGKMPQPNYVRMHSEAKLTDEQVASLKTWVTAERAKIAPELAEASN